VASKCRGKTAATSSAPLSPLLPALIIEVRTLPLQQ
jgi:hypothetical protein